MAGLLGPEELIADLQHTLQSAIRARIRFVSCC